MKPIVIALCGAKGHGKDTAAEVLIREYGFKKVAFADGLRQTVCTALRCNDYFFLDPSKKEEIDPRTGKPRRYWLQYLGTEGFRRLWPDIWVEWWAGEIAARGYDKVVVTDMRFPNEFAKVTGGDYRNLTVHINNPFIKDPHDMHESERYHYQFPVDARILNNRGISELHLQIESLTLQYFPEVW